MKESVFLSHGSVTPSLTAPIRRMSLLLVVNLLYLVDPETHILPYYLSLCPVGERTCSSNQFTCPTWYPGHPRCVPLNAVCDRVNDCGDGSDELNCKYDTCSSSQFTCGNGACIPASYTCDGSNDCLDGSDEADSLCVTLQPTCSPQQYMCSSGECIDLHKVCNGQKDCQDNSDEKGCENPCSSHHLTCSHLCLIAPGGQQASCECPDHFIGIALGFQIQCVADCSSTQFRCGDNEKCVPIWWKCDGQSDCGDGSDEPQTCPPRYCRIGQFQCRDGNCTFPGFLCDGHPDCPDSSDEDAALCSDHRCEVNQFQCKNKKCIPVSWHCDGFTDCSDGSDEDAETCAQKTCRPGEFKCANGRCLPSSYVCDAQDDCGDGSDEPFETCSKYQNGSGEGLVLLERLACSCTFRSHLSFIFLSLLSGSRIQV
uniref:Low density lipoprotein receptor-related protein 2b n=1 Tax=Xiphophorus maculatus TaxID=8083 RepID=A0A3B5QVA8_XIPMA